MRSLLALLGLVMLASVAGAADEELSPGQWREKERFGLGFGLVAGYAVGAHLYGDYNLSGALQLHVDLANRDRIENTVLGGNALETVVTTLTGALRYFPQDSQGWFVGGGTGTGAVKQTYSFGSTVTSTASFIPIFFDAGWQGWDGYYFTVNLQLGGTIETALSDHTGDVPNISNHQSLAKSDFRDARSIGANGIFIGFGWYFPAPVKRAEAAK